MAQRIQIYRTIYELNLIDPLKIDIVLTATMHTAHPQRAIFDGLRPSVTSPVCSQLRTDSCVTANVERGHK